MLTFQVVKANVLKARWRLLFGVLSGLILLVSFIPRFWDIMKFLPYYAIDENEIVEIAAGFLGGDLDQRFYAYGPLMSYLLAGIYLVMAVLSPLSADELVQQVFFNNTVLYYTARFFNGCLAIGTGWVMFGIVRRLWGVRLAWFSLPLLMFPFTDMVVAFTVRVDTLLGLMYALAVLFMVRAIEGKSLSDVLWSAFFTGLAFACKPLLALLLFPSLMVGILFLNISARSAYTSYEGRAGWQRIKSLIFLLFDLFKGKRFYLFLVVFVTTAVLVFPHTIFNWSGTNGFLAQQTGRIAFEGAKNTTPPGWQIYRHLGIMGLAYVSTGLIGLLWGLIKAFRRSAHKHVVVLMLPLVMFVAFSPFAARDYWYEPVVSFFACGVVVVAEEVFSRIRSGQIRRLAGVLILLLMLSEPAAFLARNSRIRIPNHQEAYTTVHTAFAADKWVRANVADRACVALYGYYVQMPRLVDGDINRFGNVAEFYMYYKSKNRYFIRQFELAYGRYLRDKSNRTYRLIDEITFTDDAGKNVKLDLRYRTGLYEARLLDLFKEHSVEYLVTTYEMGDGWNSMLEKSFLRSEYGYGSDVFIYRISG